ncbi:hypothetical protein [Thermosipho sp. 1074]|uniref:hypothetical protein n=1 Tax=Thermosipho sp. 1074 TaxID=1643331 RepID=UPI0009858D89|nr:hypothetical protein [Thermosipho sp. 1074]OOC42170.1 hypothetical protein XO08_07750 [Thermosipho sp. 1074]
MRTITVEGIVEELAKINEYMHKLKERKQLLMAQLEEVIERPIDKNYVNIGAAKISWRRSIKINPKYASMYAEKYPELAKRIFSVSYRPKITALERIKTAAETGKLPDWAEPEAVKDLLSQVEYEEKMSVTFQGGENNE